MALSLLCVTLPFVWVPAGQAAPVVVEVRLSRQGEDLAALRQAALAAAQERALEVLVRRHVPPDQVKRRWDEVKARVLSRPGRHVVRYAVLAEGVEGEELRVEAEVEVQRDQVLTALRGGGFTVHTLATPPRVLIMPRAGPEPSSAAVTVAEVWEREGFRVRLLPAEEGMQEAGIAAAAQDLGCHVALLVSAAAGPRTAAESDGDGAPEGDAPQVRVEATAEGWLVDARAETALGRGEGRGLGTGAGEGAVGEAAARALATAGRRLAYQLLSYLEQSGWSPGTETRLLDLHVNGLVTPRVVETLQAELSAVTEVRIARLRTVGHRSASWRLEAWDSGLGWDAVLASVRTANGALRWRHTESSGEDEVPVTVWGVWEDRP